MIVWDVWENNILSFLEPFDIVMLSWTCREFVVFKKSKPFLEQMRKMYSELHERTKERLTYCNKGVSIFTIMFAHLETCVVCKHPLKNGSLITQYNIYCHKKCATEYVIEIFYDGRSVELVSNKRKRIGFGGDAFTRFVGMYYWGHPHYDIVMPSKHEYIFFDDDVKKLNDYMDFDDDRECCNDEYIGFFVKNVYVSTIKSYSKKFCVEDKVLGCVDIVDIFFQGDMYDICKMYDQNVNDTLQLLEQKKERTREFLEKCESVFESEKAFLIDKNVQWPKHCYDNFSVKSFLVEMMFDIHRFKKKIRERTSFLNRINFLKMVKRRLMFEKLLMCTCSICRKCVQFPTDEELIKLCGSSVNFVNTTEQEYGELFNNIVKYFILFWESVVKFVKGKPWRIERHVDLVKIIYDSNTWGMCTRKNVIEDMIRTHVRNNAYLL